jgi:hypothetical protein
MEDNEPFIPQRPTPLPDFLIGECDGVMEDFANMLAEMEASQYKVSYPIERFADGKLEAAPETTRTVPVNKFTAEACKADLIRCSVTDSAGY